MRRSKRAWRIIVILLLGQCSSTNSRTLSVKVLTQSELAHFTLMDEQVLYTGTDACVRKVTDGVHQFVLKQIIDPLLDEQFLLINDAVASTIGWQAGIKVNQVFFIPYDVASRLKIYPGRAATLHTYIVGHDLEALFPACLFEHFDIHQHVIDQASSWQQHYPLAEDQQGLTTQVIESMSLTEQLVGICALDTFVGNHDRSLPNIFYNPVSGIFYGIDQAAAFSKCLPQLACARINELIKVGYFEQCSPEVLVGLSLYQITLHRLYTENEPAAIFQSMVDLVSYLAPDAFSSDDVKDRLTHHWSVIENNYRNSLELIGLLEGVLYASRSSRQST